MDSNQRQDSPETQDKTKHNWENKKKIKVNDY